ncbi:MAG TPA: cobalamin-binding protein [Anaerolineales bacterium]|nr:cobalamin-binding protein [Anaerolineales bacterium]HNO30869.1 cobalamin-binding protein [Anaerolineales bacterium]
MFRKTLILTLLVALLAACAPAPSTPVVDSAPTDAAATEAVATEAATESAAYLVTSDGLGREVTLAAPAERVVSLAPSTTEILFAVGAGAQVVGRDEFSDYPAEAAAIESVGGSMGEYSVESIVALEPDLVLAAEINTPELVSQLEELGLTVFYVNNPTTIEEMYGSLENVAALTGHDASELIDALKARVAAVDEKIAPISARPSVFYEIDASDPAKPYTYGPGTFGNLLIERAGGYNIGSEAADMYPQLSLEQIVVTNPSIILLGDSMWGVTPESVLTREGWGEIEAVKSSQVFPIDDNLISRPGPRLVDGLEALAKILHPGLFP